ncbi:MAG: hypothetical protein U0360_08255 [Dehalococcoidia bacterium]
MPQQYVATDSRTGLQVMVTGDFPDDPDDRVRIARTSTLFTRLMATILATENAYERRERFRAVETQLEIAEALIRQDTAEVQRLLRDTLSQLGVSDDQMREIEDEIRRRLRDMGGPDLPFASPDDDN